MSADLEARLRASLAAYADLVEDDADAPLPQVRPPSAAVRRWRAPLLVAAAVASVVTLGVTVWPASTPTGDSAASVADAGGAGGAESAAGAGEEQRAEDAGEDSGATAMSAPEAGGPEVGVPVPFELYTHCGVLGADVGGTWFAADPPLVEEPAGPPAGWDDPYQAGTLTLLTGDEALFTDDAGHEVRLVADEELRPPPCD
ncbi:hypothetical protein [Blastococcus sp. PRF04-17]|uniref:hypothetical protein n=1 Tax=Blastococcus sp. PRF04-17 TaxID=2933797 RepID=UPI001FF6BB96|nr:hypothetical protein [Blastococcus sp. PRF04-17]UOY03559.1 hypothetical protein MVA48_09625 [Blastococcus sp. PRF04-17]